MSNSVRTNNRSITHQHSETAMAIATPEVLLAAHDEREDIRGPNNTISHPSSIGCRKHDLL